MQHMCMPTESTVVQAAAVLVNSSWHTVNLLFLYVDLVMLLLNMRCLTGSYNYQLIMYVIWPVKFICWKTQANL